MLLMLIKQQLLRTSTADSFSVQGCFMYTDFYNMYVHLNVSCFVSFFDAFLKEKCVTCCDMQKIIVSNCQVLSLGTGS